MARSNSSSNVGFLQKLRYSLELFRMRSKMAADEESFLEGLAELRGYIADFERETGKKASESSVVEIGFGARPRRAFMLSGLFKQVYAIDLDAPILTTADVLRAARKNGIERAVKSLVRHVMFDSREWPRFHKALAKVLPQYDPGKVRFVLGSAGSPAVWAQIGQVDLALSIDVFEHIPPEDLRKTLIETRAHLAADGIVITRPCVFTGIVGGHNLEWYPHCVEGQTADTAWSHLIDPDFQVNTYVNRLKRADFRAMFTGCGFTVTRDEAKRGRFGEKHLTAANRASLAAYDEYELFSNEVEFVLKPAGAVAASGAAA